MGERRGSGEAGEGAAGREHSISLVNLQAPGKVCDLLTLEWVSVTPTTGRGDRGNWQNDDRQGGVAGGKKITTPVRAKRFLIQQEK